MRLFAIVCGGLWRSVAVCGGRGRSSPTATPSGLSDQPCFWSKNCSSSVEPFSAAVEALASIVVVTASK